MKTKSRKNLLSALFIVFSIVTFGQTENRFYKTLEDYINDKPIAGFEIVSNSYNYVAVVGISTESFKVLKNGQKEKMELSKLPSELYTYGRSLSRTYDGSTYIVLAVGHYCYYIQQHDNSIKKYSESIKGDLKKFKEGWLEDELEKNGLLEDYKKDKPHRETHETESTWLTKIVSRDVKYINLLNEKLKKE